MTRMTNSFLSAACAALAILPPSSYAFIAPSSSTSSYDVLSSKSSALAMYDIERSSTTTNRRGFMHTAATAAIAGVSSVWMTPSPAMAYGLDKANSKLAR